MSITFDANLTENFIEVVLIKSNTLSVRFCKYKE